MRAASNIALERTAGSHSLVLPLSAAVRPICTWHLLLNNRVLGMAADPVQLAMQAHLAEFAALRQEMVGLIKRRDQLVFIALATSGALFSFAFSTSGSDVDSSRRLSLYLVTPLSTAIGGLWLGNELRIRRIGAYLRNVTGRRVNALLATAGGDTWQGADVLSWESSSERTMFRWSRRVFDGFVTIVAFVGAGVLAQAAILLNSRGRLGQRILDLEFPVVFIINWLVLGAAVLWLCSYLIAYLTRCPEGSSNAEMLLDR